MREGGCVMAGRVESAAFGVPRPVGQRGFGSATRATAFSRVFPRLFTLVPRLDMSIIRHIARLDIARISDEHTTTYTLGKSRHILEEHNIRAQHVARRRHVLGAPATRGKRCVMIEDTRRASLTTCADTGPD
jgi:hypothetical protein